MGLAVNDANTDAQDDARAWDTEQPTQDWRRAFDCQAGSCVAVAPAPDGDVLVCNNNHPGVQLRFAAAEWWTFIAGVMAGDFDDLGLTQRGRDE